MALTAIGGDVSSQTLNDNFSYLDTDKMGKSELYYIDAKSYANAAGDNATNDTAALQAALDNAPDNSVIVFPPFTYLVSKNANLTDFPDNDQPCLLLRNKKNIHIIGYGATLHVDVHAQGILELQECSNITIEGLKYEGYGSYPALEGTTGRGEKGTDTAGYDTRDIWGKYKNNSLDTSAYTTHGNGGSAWGTFGGGFIGNVAYGLLVHRGCEDVTVRSCESTGFNYSGFYVGHLGDYTPTDLGYADSIHTVFESCVAHDNYNAGFASRACDGLTYVACHSHDIGHPDAQLTDDVVDPGYGIGCNVTAFSPSKNVTVQDCRIVNAKRKGIDAHTAIGFYVENNYVNNSWAQGIFANWVDSDNPTYNLIIKGNEVENCGVHATDGNGAIGIRTPQTGTQVGGPSNAIVSNNRALNCSTAIKGIIQAETFNRLTMIGNQIIGTDTRLAMSSIYAYYLGDSDIPSDSLVMLGNMVDISDLGVSRGIVVDTVNEGIVANNFIILVHSGVDNGMYSSSNGDVNFTSNYVKIGSTGKPFSLAQTNGYISDNKGVGGDTASLFYGSGSHIASLISPPTSADNGTFYQVQDTDRLEAFNSGQRGQIRKVIHVRVTGNATSGGSVSIYGGDDYVGAVASTSNGFSIAVKGLGTLNPFMSVMNASSGGMTNGTTEATYIYNHSVGPTSVEVGLKADINGAHMPLSTITNGSVDVMVMI